MKQLLAAAVITVLMGSALADGAFAQRGTASKGGTTVDVALDYQGNVVSK